MSKTSTEKTSVEITELTAIEPTRVDGVGVPANGFPILMMKSLAAPAGTAAVVKDGCGCGPDCTCATKTAPSAKPKKSKAAKAAAKAARLAPDPQMPDTGSASGTNTSSTQAANITPDVIAKAVAEATAPLEAQLKSVQEQMAKVLATPIPGGPQLVTPQAPRTPASQATQKADRLRAIAHQTIDPDTRASYLELAAREEGAPITKD